MVKVLSIIAVYFLVTAIIVWSVYNLIKHFKKNNRHDCSKEGECQGCCENCSMSNKNDKTKE